MRGLLSRKAVIFILAALAFGISAINAASDVPPSGTQPADEGAVSMEELVGRFVLARTKGGGEFQGTLLSVGEDRIEILGAEGLIEFVHRASLLSVESVETRWSGGDERDLYFRDAASNRLILMPSAFGMEAGEFHVTAQEIVIVTMSYGFSPHLSVWGGISIPGALGNLRYSLDIGGSSALSLGSFVGMTWMEPIGLVMPYGIFSLGDPDRNLTAALAVPMTFSAADPYLVAGAILALGGKSVVSRTASLVTENWFFWNSDGGAWSRVQLLVFPSIAFRIAGGRFSWDIGAVLPFELTVSSRVWHFGGVFDGSFMPIPLLSFTYRLH